MACGFDMTVISPNDLFSVIIPDVYRFVLRLSHEIIEKKRCHLISYSEYKAGVDVQKSSRRI